MVRAKASMNSLDIHFIRRELEPLAGAFLNKVHMPNRGLFVLRLNTPSGRRDILVELGRRVHLATDLPENPLDPGSFASYLRKRLTNARLTGVRQPNFDRILAFDFEKDGNWTIVFEIFKDGNALVLKDGVIQLPLHRREYKHRRLAVGETYQPPPGGNDPTGIDDAAFWAAVEPMDTIGRGLAYGLSLGPQGAEEVLARSGVGFKVTPGEIEPVKRGFIAEEVRKLISEAPSPRVYSSGGIAVDFSAVELRTKPGLESKIYESFSLAIEDYFRNLPADEEPDEEAESLRRTAESQRKRVEELEKEAASLQASVEYFYSHFQEIDDAASGLRKAVGESGWGALADKALVLPTVVSVDAKARTASVKLEDGAPVLVIAIGEDINASASRIYDAVKKAKSRIGGAEKALEETLKRLDERSSPEPKPARRKERRKEWYESCRWMYTSDGLLVVSGKDAKGNERVVSKYLREGDRYIHADLPGAPSTVLRRGEGEIPESSIGEACVFAVVHSKAWKTGLGSASAYWVTPDQVSKTPNAGEFVAKGSFIVRGKRNYFHKVGLVCALGVGEIDGYEKVMGGPVAAVSARCPKFVTLVPGKTPKEDLANALSQTWGLPQDEILASMPPGPCDVIEASGFAVPPAIAVKK